MRTFMILTLGMWIATVAVFGVALPCATGTYTSYVALGATGCTIGDATFNNFSALAFVNSGGVPALTGAQIEVIPSGSPTNATLSYVYVDLAGAPAPVTVSTTGAIFSFGFSYGLIVSPSHLSAIDMTATFSNTSPGGVSATKNAQIGAGPVFTSTVNDNGISNPLATYIGAGALVSGIGTWVIKNDTSLQANGTGGVATECRFTNVFTLASDVSTPEPLPLAMVGFGLIGLGLISRKTRKI